LALGACVDTEVDAGLPLDTTGDDVSTGTSLAGTCAVAGDDEDGVTFDTPLIACRDADLTVTATDAGLLDAWVDFDADGSFDVADRIFTAQALVAGPNALTFAVPCTASPATTSVRFRFSSTGVAGPTGQVMDGEVEDYTVEQWGVDFGDDPDSYQTLFSSGGAFHTVDPNLGLFLGSCVDTEADGAPGATADGDDLATGSSVLGTCAGTDDEDGVTFDTLITACKSGQVTVTASAAGLLDAWIDFGADGSFAEAGDQVFASEPLVVGPNVLAYSVPCSATDATTYARFRFSAAGGLGFDGPADSGEVEDYVITTETIDFGDAPDSFSTLLASGGPSHDLDPGVDLYLGSCVDGEINGQPSVGADGDDVSVGGGTVGTCNGTDDEDGVTFDSMVNVCLDATITVTAASAGVLDAWLDLDGDGTFAGPDDRIFTAEALVPGPNVLVFSVPCDATPGDSYARFRFSSTGVATATGPAADGEVEDYAVLVAGFDFGDAPDPAYPTLLANDGARHIVQVSANPVLGATVDIEPEALQSADHQGDDQDGVDDEDGIVFLDDDGILVPGTTTTLEVSAGATGGLLDAFIDWNRDGDWDDVGEQIATSLPVAANTTVPLTVDVPVGAVAGASCARFRLSSAGGLGSTGQALDGEVEDYGVEIGVEDPVLGLGKELLLVEQQGVNRWLVRLEMMVENLGNVPLSGIQIEANFAAAFAEADGFTIDLVTSGQLTINPAFDGDLVPLVLTGTDVLEVGGSGTVLVDLTLRPGTEEGPYICSSLVTGTPPSGQEVDDPSQDGGDPDPDDDGDPGNDNDPTVIEIQIPIPEIPVAGELGLVLLALLLAGAAVLRLRGT
jgi:hypothetical protein